MYSFIKRNRKYLKSGTPFLIELRFSCTNVNVENQILADLHFSAVCRFGIILVLKLVVHKVHTRPILCIPATKTSPIDFNI